MLLVSCDKSKWPTVTGLHMFVTKKHRGFRLGRRLAVVWRWAFHQRRGNVSRCTRPKHYLRFSSITNAVPPYERSPWSLSLSDRPSATSMTSKFLDWTRHLGRCLHRGHDGGKKAYCRLGVPLLEEYHDAGDGWRKPPPKGFLAVYLGGKDDDGGGGGGGGGATRRYLVPVIYFNHPLFRELLREAEEEFGFRHPGGITIPCDSAEFEQVRTRIAAGGDRRKGAKVW